jgi:hypothetical protein
MGNPYGAENRKWVRFRGGVHFLEKSKKLPLETYASAIFGYLRLLPRFPVLAVQKWTNKYTQKDPHLSL